MQLPKNKSNRKAVVLTADKFEDMEVFFPVFRLLEEGWQVDIAAPGMKESGENGYLLKPNKTIEEVDPGEYDLRSSNHSGRSAEWSAGDRAQNQKSAGDS